jgi:hypothetical protein
VADVFDLDDDNDGILDTVEGNSCVVLTNDFQIFNDLTIKQFNLVYNGDFDLGDIGFTTTYTKGNIGACGAYIVSPTGWVSSTGSLSEGNAMQINADCEAPFTSFWSQTVSVKPNTNYKLGFSIRNGNPAAVSYSINGGTLQGNFGTTGNWVSKQATINSGNRTTMAISLFEVTGQPMSADFGVDDIFLIEIKDIYCTQNLDTDNDGLMNHLDVDSDGDGCYDAVEAGVLSSTNNGIVSGDYGRNGFANGLETISESGVYKNTYSYAYAVNASFNACLDTDGDGVTDLNDIDDDNDGILDRIECDMRPRKILIAGSTESYLGMRANLFAEFDNYKLAGATIVESNIIESATVPAGFYEGYDMVVFGGAAFNTIHANHWTALQAAIQNKTSKAFIIQSDNCCVVANQNGLTNLLNTVFGTSYSISSTRTTATNDTYSKNTSNTYSNQFTTNSLLGGIYFPMLGVASSDILFSSSSNATETVVGLKQLPGTTDKNRFVSWFVDGSVTQTTPWYAANVGKIATAFYDTYSSASAFTCDTDNDGIYNHLDLDSDGDGCSDAKESNIRNLRSGAIKNGTIGSITTTTVDNAIAGTTGNYGVNGFANVLETANESGIYSGTYNYSFSLNATLNACLDTDDDGVTDIYDIDDDNDGILDVIEMTNCNSSLLITPSSATSSPVYGGSVAARTIDGSGFTGSGLSALASAPAVLEDSWLLKEPLTSGFIEYNLPGNSNIGGVVLWAPDANNYGGGDAPPKDFTVEITYNNGQVFTTGIYTTEQPNGSGSNRGAQPFYFPQTFLNATKVKLNLLNGWYDINNNSLNQVSTDGITVSAAYNMFLSEFRVLCGATDMDTDNDGIPNRLDLDSDGDGCADALEAGINKAILTTGSAINLVGSTIASGTTSSTLQNAVIANLVSSSATFGTNGFANTLETSIDNGIYSSSYNYGYAIYAGSSVCLDSDGDAISDVFDLDDDNDGVLDQAESSSCSTTPNYTLRNIKGTTTGVLPYNSSFPAWMLNQFTESEDGYRLIFDQPVSDVVLQFASIYQDDRIGDFTVKLKDGTIIAGIDFNLLTSYGPTNSIWTPQPNNTSNFNGNFSKFYGTPFSTGTPYFRTTSPNTVSTQSWGIVQLKNIAGAAEVGISELSFRISGGFSSGG